MNIPDIPTLVGLIWYGLIEGKRQYLYYNKRRHDAYVLDKVISNQDALLASFGPNDYECAAGEATKKEIQTRVFRELNKIYEGAHIRSSLESSLPVMRNHMEIE